MEAGDDGGMTDRGAAVLLMKFWVRDLLFLQIILHLPAIRLPKIDSQHGFTYTC